MLHETEIGCLKPYILLTHRTGMDKVVVILRYFKVVMLEWCWIVTYK